MLISMKTATINPDPRRQADRNCLLHCPVY